MEMKRRKRLMCVVEKRYTGYLSNWDSFNPWSSLAGISEREFLPNVSFRPQEGTRRCKILCSWHHTYTYPSRMILTYVYFQYHLMCREKIKREITSDQQNTWQCPKVPIALEWWPLCEAARTQRAVMKIKTIINMKDGTRQSHKSHIELQV